MRRIAGTFIFCAVLLFMPAKALPAKLTSLDVERAINSGLAYLRSQQQSGGFFRYQSQEWDVGATSLAALSLAMAGTPADDPVLSSAIQFIVTKSPGDRRTYQYALQIMVLAAVDPKKYRDQISMAVNWLQDAQLPNGRWNYNKSHIPTPDEGDNSNTQFAVLGLYNALGAGIPVSKKALQQTEQMFIATQNADGGWGYRRNGPSSVSMTSAALASLFICGNQLFTAGEVCGQYSENPTIAKGMAYLEAHRNDWFTVGGFLFYTLYAIERVGVLSSEGTIGKHDWFLDGADFLLKHQKQNGSWADNVADTSFALLFLIKGKAPLVLQKLQWPESGNRGMNDVQNITRFYAQRTGENIGWQVIDLDAPLEELVKAPILFISGTNPPALTAEKLEKLRAYVRNGGTIWAEARCGMTPFHNSVGDLVESLWPGRKLQLLPADHPIYNVFFDVKESPFVYGVNVGCRIGLFYHKRDMSFQWEKRQYDSFAFKTGVNMIHFVIGGRRLFDRLAEVKPVEQDKPPEFVPGVLTLAQLRYHGEWETDPNALDNLADSLRKRLNMNVSTRKAVVSASSDEIFAYPILFITGHDYVALTDEEIGRLRLYIERGGFILAEACCGRTEFDISMRRLTARLFPDRKLEKVPSGDPIYSSAFALDSVAYKEAVLKQNPEMKKPELEGVRFADRWALVYSKYSLGCAWENHVCPGCLGLENMDALKLGANIIVYDLAN